MPVRGYTIAEDLGADFRQGSMFSPTFSSLVRFRPIPPILFWDSSDTVALYLLL